MMPVGKVYSNQNIWYILYSHEVRRPNSDAYIRFYSQLNNEKVNNYIIMLFSFEERTILYSIR